MMECTKVMDLLEEYIVGELDTSESNLIKQHLRICKSCSEEYDEMRNMIEKIRLLKGSLKVREDVLTMNRMNISKKTIHETKSVKRFIPVFAASVLFMFTVMTGSILFFPSFTSAYAPALPIVKEMNVIREENRKSEDILEQLKAENSELKLELVKIREQNIKQVNTSDTVTQDERTAVQQLAVDFILAQYKGDLEAIKSISTESYKKIAEKDKATILIKKKGEAIFTQITNVAKEGDKYLVFVRLNDTGANSDSDYQENFEIVKVNGKYLVDFMGIDA